MFFATWPHFAVFYCYVLARRIAECGLKKKAASPLRAGHNVVMTDAAIKDNYDSGNRFYFRVYLFCSCVPLNPPFSTTAFWFSLIAKTDAMFVPVVVAATGTKVDPLFPLLLPLGVAMSTIQHLLFG